MEDTNKKVNSKNEINTQENGFSSTKSSNSKSLKVEEVSTEVKKAKVRKGEEYLSRGKNLKVNFTLYVILSLTISSYYVIKNIIIAFDTKQIDLVIFSVLSIIYTVVMTVLVPSYVVRLFNKSKKVLDNVDDILDSSEETPDSPLKDVIDNYKANINKNCESKNIAGYFFNSKEIISRSEKRYPVLDLIEDVQNHIVVLMMIGVAILMINASYLFAQGVVANKEIIDMFFINVGNLIMFLAIISIFYKFLVYNPISYKMDLYFNILSERLDSKYRTLNL